MRLMQRPSIDGFMKGGQRATAVRAFKLNSLIIAIMMIRVNITGDHLEALYSMQSTIWSLPD